ncbi:hypothetical protein GXW76_02235 [Roseomonas soli]|uniref:Uncharacterized protein n=1 Tax=Neoroseomonas soli TaxID=1081025 RepID=A0A9X9WS52_9PROT|nr:hypothetical protein [Neoroseomonas soli]
MIAAAWARVQGWLALVGATLAALGAAYLAGRRDGRDARHAEAAREEQRTRRAADAAAREAERDGAAERLRRGDF